MDTPFSPVSPQAHAITQLFDVVVVVMALILILITALVLYACAKFRHRPGAPVPHQNFGHKKIEIAWTAAFVLILAVLFGFTVSAMHGADPPPPDSRKPDLVITAHQWWWEAEYPGGIFAANEIHIPTGQAWLVELLSADVIHDWWVPRIGRKMDAVPGYPNRIWIEADQPGIYGGACAEYCGAEHAWMRIRVVAQAPADYQRWLAAQARPAAAPSADLKPGADLFGQLACGNCHAIAGTEWKARVGPDLTHFASRETLASGRLRNTPANLDKWIADPQSVKPGANMPNFRLTADQIRQLDGYLESLQ